MPRPGPPPPRKWSHLHLCATKTGTVSWQDEAARPSPGPAAAKEAALQPGHASEGTAPTPSWALGMPPPEAPPPEPHREDFGLALLLLLLLDVLLAPLALSVVLALPLRPDPDPLGCCPSLELGWALSRLTGRCRRKGQDSRSTAAAAAGKAGRSASAPPLPSPAATSPNGCRAHRRGVQGASWAQPRGSMGARSPRRGRRNVLGGQEMTRFDHRHLQNRRSSVRLQFWSTEKELPPPR